MPLGRSCDDPHGLSWFHVSSVHRGVGACGRFLSPLTGPGYQHPSGGGTARTPVPTSRL